MGHVVHLSSARWFNNYSESWVYFLPVWLRDGNFENTKCWEACSEMTLNSNIKCCTLYSDVLIIQGHVQPQRHLCRSCRYQWLVWLQKYFPISPQLLEKQQDGYFFCVCVYKYAHTFCSRWRGSWVQHHVGLCCTVAASPALCGAL